jgi:hypothetical protein
MSDKRESKKAKPEGIIYENPKIMWNNRRCDNHAGIIPAYFVFIAPSSGGRSCCFAAHHPRWIDFSEGDGKPR